MKRLRRSATSFRNVNRVTLASALLSVLPWLASSPLEAADAEATAPEPASETRVATTRQGDDAIDRMDLDATSITGNRELPKVMSIVPWKAAEPPAGPDRPMGSLIEDVLSPVDRDEFRREITYYHDLTSQSTTDGAAAGVTAAGVEDVRAEPKSSSPPGASIP